jgi:hypothetical protein
MDADEEELIGRKRRRRMLALLVSLPFVAAMGGGVWFFVTTQRRAYEKVLIEQVSGAAYGCVTSVRGDAPETWGLDLALEHMSRMERVTRSGGEGPDVERFTRAATDAARGCEELGRLMMQARAEAPHLYFAVPAKLAQPPEGEHERWYRRVLPKSRTEVEELARQIRGMQEAINARRGEHTLMPLDLPIEGRGTPRLARQVELAPLPRELSEAPLTEAWPLPDRVVVLRRGSIPRVPCDTRFVNRASCYSDFVQEITWEGEIGPARALERPTFVSYWAAFAATADGSLWAVGVDRQDRGIVGRYLPGSTVPELSSPLAAMIDGATTMAEIVGGVAVFASDESVWISSGTIELTRTTDPVVRLVLEPAIDDMATASGPERGVTVDGVGTLSVFGSIEEGFISRLTTPDGEVLQRMIDAHQRVRSIAGIRALSTGHTVAVLQRQEASPDAVALSTDLGRTWVAQPTR